MSDVKKEVIPTLEAYLPNDELVRLIPNIERKQYVPCPYCGSCHVHGQLPEEIPPEGFAPLSSHCKAPNAPGRYYLKIVGEIGPDEYIEQYERATYVDSKRWGCSTERQCKLAAKQTGVELRRLFRKRRKNIAEIAQLRADVLRRRKLYGSHDP